VVFLYWWYLFRWNVVTEKRKKSGKIKE